MMLSRFDPSKPATVDNIVLLTGKEADILKEKGLDAFDSSTVERIREKLNSLGEWNWDW